MNGAINVRVLNRTLGWNLPTDGPRTLNGLIVEYLETLPQAGTVLRLGDLTIEILQTIDNSVKTARIRPTPAATLDSAQKALRSASASRSTPITCNHRSRAAACSLPARSPLEAVLGSRRRSSPYGTGRISPARPSSPKHTRRPASGSSRAAGNRREDRRQIGGRLRNAHAADDVDENIAARGRNAAVPMQHSEQQRETVRFQPDRDTARILPCASSVSACTSISIGLLPARHHDCAAADRLRVLRENRRRILHFLEALLGHGEHADFVGGAERFLTARTSRKRLPASLSKYSTVSTMCSRMRGPAITPSLVTCPMISTDTPVAFAKRTSAAAGSRTCAADPGEDSTSVANMVWIESMTSTRAPVSRAWLDDRVDGRFRQQLQRVAGQPETAGAQADLPQRFLAGHVQRRRRAAERIARLQQHR